MLAASLKKTDIVRLIAKSKSNIDKAVRLMINESDDGIYIFGFDTMIDSYSKWDYFFDNIEDAKEFGEIEYEIGENEWIEIESEQKECQQDWIESVTLKRKNDKSYFCSKNTGQLIDLSDRTHDINGMTVNERLYVVGLYDEFYKIKEVDSSKARKILEYINVDKESIDKTIKPAANSK